MFREFRGSLRMRRDRVANDIAIVDVPRRPARSHFVDDDRRDSTGTNSFRRQWRRVHAMGAESGIRRGAVTERTRCISVA
jgi:hypothetical protein